MASTRDRSEAARSVRHQEREPARSANIVIETRFQPLPFAFYRRSPLELAPALIGKLLVHQSKEGIAAGRIVETEAYMGPEDLAAHSAGGRRTRRTEAMFGRAGTVYMFLLYGRSWAFNIVASEVEEPHAVLVRAVEPALGIPLIEARRGMSAAKTSITNGPGKLCAALGLTGEHYGHDLCDHPLFIADAPTPPGAIGQSERINIDYAGEWRTRPWRYYERGNRFVSVRPRD